MPITYQPAEPIAPGVSALAGAAQQWSRDEPSLVAQQGHLAQAYQGAMQGQQHSLDFISRIMQEQAQRTQQTQNLILQHQLGQQDQQQRVQMQAWLQQQDLSAQEQTRLSRLQSALGSVMTDENLSPQEKMDYATKLRTGIDPYQQRLEASRQRQMDQQYKEAQEATKRANSLRTMSASELAAHVASHSTPIGTTGNVLYTGDPTKPQIVQDHSHEHVMEAARIRADAATSIAEMKHKHDLEIQQVRNEAAAERQRDPITPAIIERIEREESEAVANENKERQTRGEAVGDFQGVQQTVGRRVRQRLEALRQHMGYQGYGQPAQQGPAQQQQNQALQWLQGLFGGAQNAGTAGAAAGGAAAAG